MTITADTTRGEQLNAQHALRFTINFLNSLSQLPTFVLQSCVSLRDIGVQAPNYNNKNLTE